MKKNPDHQSTDSPPDGASRPKSLTAEPPREDLGGAVREHEAPRVMFAGVGYVPGRLADWLLGRGGRPGGPGEALDSEEQPDRRLPIIMVLAALASFIAAVFDWRAGDHHGAVVALLVAVGFAAMAGAQRKPTMAWPALASFLFAGALVVYGFLT